MGPAQNFQTVSEKLFGKAGGVGRWRTLRGMKRRYSTDLSDDEWRYLEPHAPAPKGRGRPRIHTTREVLDAVFYVLKTGCQWRLLPRDFPPWETVYWWFGRWRADGTFERLNAALREALRARSGRDRFRAPASPTPSRPKPPGWAASREGVRRGEEGARQEASPAGGHRGFGPQGQGPQSAKVPDQDGLRLLLQSARTGLLRPKHPWLDTG